MRWPWTGHAPVPVRSVHCPAKRAAVSASPVTPGSRTPAATMASTAAAIAAAAIGVAVAAKSSGDWRTRPAGRSRSRTTQ